MSMSIALGAIPFEVAPTVVALARYQARSIWLMAAGRAEARIRHARHIQLPAHEQYRRHIASGGYRP